MQSLPGLWNISWKNLKVVANILRRVLVNAVRRAAACLEIDKRPLRKSITTTRRTWFDDLIAWAIWHWRMCWKLNVIGHTSSALSTCFFNKELHHGDLVREFIFTLYTYIHIYIKRVMWRDMGYTDRVRNPSEPSWLGTIPAPIANRTSVIQKSSDFWNTIMPCSPVKVNKRSGGKYRLHLQGRRLSEARNRNEAGS
jgi:hypothetical protein